MNSNAESTIVICGAGTMGTGIAQLASQAGYEVYLFDPLKTEWDGPLNQLRSGFSKMVKKGKITLSEMERLTSRIHFSPTLPAISPVFCIEAITEDLQAKTSLFGNVMDRYGSGTCYATNTSSISVTDIAGKTAFPQSLGGMHFFNPAPVMSLVEVVRAANTAEPVVSRLCALAREMGKTPVIVRDTPGFIVNRVARPFYLEAMRMAEEGVADFRDMDRLLEASGFRMGPFALTDLIGQDINLAVSESLYGAFANEPRFKPSSLQVNMVRSGRLGRKTGSGFYDYPSPS
jgi:3-hydroxybutyryl-CoA dehydrogenase